MIRVRCHLSLIQKKCEKTEIDLGRRPIGLPPTFVGLQLDRAISSPGQLTVTFTRKFTSRQYSV